jgi:hypothetical protein
MSVISLLASGRILHAVPKFQMIVTIAEAAKWFQVAPLDGA